MKDVSILAIDQGTTGSTALVLDAEGAVRGRGYAELPQHFPRPGWVEHDAEEIWSSVLEAIGGALRASALDPRRLAAIGVTNQRETTLLWERRSGTPVGRAIVWQDRRTADRCAALRRRGLETAVRRRTGLRLDPYFSGTKLAWMLDHGARARARKGELAFGTMDSWVIWKLTGGAEHVTDPTNASRTLLYDVGRLEWSRPMLDLFGVPPSLLPRVVPSAGVLGTTRGVPGLPDGVPIAGVAGDQQAALYGQGCVRAGQSKNTYGTGCFLLAHTGPKRLSSRSGLLTTVACGPRGEPHYALEGSVFVAGAAIQWLRDGLNLIEAAPESEALARTVPDSGGVVLVPAFVGLGAPYWRPEVRGAFFGLTRGTTRAHVARATLESIAFQTRDVADAMAKDARRSITVMRVDGGAVSNDLLMQLQADLLGIPVERPSVIETTALGAGLLAGSGVGLWSSASDLKKPRAVERVFHPERGRAWRESEYGRWKAAVGTLLGSSRPLTR